MKTSYSEAGFLGYRTLDSGVELGLMRMAYTYALCVNISTDISDLPYDYRYCYGNLTDCLVDFHRWDGKGHPEGNWIKRKGAFLEDLRNPDYEDV